MSEFDVGRELDALVAERVLGLDVCQDLNGLVRVHVEKSRTICLRHSHWVDRIPAFSTDIAAAWQILEHFRNQWTRATDGVDGLDNSFTRPFDDDVLFERLHRHADRRWPWAFLYVTPEAICRAALSAVAQSVS